MKLARVALSSCLLLLGGILAHHLSDNSVASISSISSFVLLSALLALLLLDDHVNEYKLLTAVFIAQNGAHFLLGGSVNESISMYLGHTIGGALTFFAINRGSEILASIESFLAFLYSRISPLHISHSKWKSPEKSWTFIPYLSCVKELFHNTTHLLRAPPLHK